MADENLTKTLKQLEDQIGKDRVRVLRAEAIRRGVTIQKVLADAALAYTNALLKTEDAA